MTLTQDSIWRAAADLWDASAPRRTSNWAAPSDLAVDLFPTYTKAPHLRLIDEALQACLNRDDDRVLICTPPQVGKSTTASEAGPAWWLHNRPRDRVVVASYAAELAEKRGRRVRNIIRDHGELMNLKLTADSHASSRWDLLTGGGMLCMGVSGGLTGNPADLAIVDDPHKDRQEAQSKVIRDAAWDWWTSTLLTRMQPEGSIVLIMTRWHEDDLASRVLELEGDKAEGGRWHTIVLPALAEADDDPLGREHGDPLPHPKMVGADREALLEFWNDKKLTVGSRDWPALYQQRPAPAEGALWKRQWIARTLEGDMPQLVRIVIGVDPAVTSAATSDETGIIVAGIDAAGRGYVLDDRTLRGTPGEWGEAVWDAFLDWDANEVLLEKPPLFEAGKYILQTTWAAVSSRRRVLRPVSSLPIRPVDATRGKTLRAEPISTLYEQGMVSHVGKLPDLEEQMLNWAGDGDSPDRVDALVHALTGLFLDHGKQGRVIVPQRWAGGRQ